MKGKYAARADRRQEFTGLEGRAVAAERDRDRLAAELAELKGSSERQAALLRDQVRRLHEERGATADDRITELEAANRRLRTRMNAAVEAERQTGQEYVRSVGRLVRWLRGSRFGLSKEEVDELIFGLEGPLPGLAPGREATVIPPLPKPGGEDLRLVAWTEERAAVKRRIAKEENASLDVLVEKFTRPIYVYDTAQSSFAIECDPAGTDTGTVRVSIEGAGPEPGAGGAVLAAMMLPSAELAKLALAIGEIE